MSRTPPAPKTSSPRKKEGKPKEEWQFSSRFRRRAYGWRSSRLAIERIKQAVDERQEPRATDRDELSRSADPERDRIEEIAGVEPPNIRSKPFYHLKLRRGAQSP
jgi:hypothetical protein